MKKIIIVGLAVFLAFTLPMAEVRMEDRTMNTPNSLYLANQFTDRCFGYPNTPVEKCEFESPLG